LACLIAASWLWSCAWIWFSVNKEFHNYEPVSEYIVGHLWPMYACAMKPNFLEIIFSIN
jgi:hypothetical protein